ncbi:MAG: nucleotide exchange factor GrpE [Acidimicrobiales bacterium]
MTDPSHDDLTADATAPPTEPSASTVSHDADEATDETVEGTADAEAGESDETADITVEDLVANLEAVTAERDNYLDGLRRLQAEFENYRKAVAKRELEARERANEGLVAELLPVLDACDGAVANGADDVAPVRVSLLEILAKQGLERIEESGTPFDPEQHEAVMHEPSDDDSGPLVSQLLRVGYRWKGRTVRPAMVQVRG